jgi:ABC-type amino acid transport substrate-binding protein
MSSSMAGVVGGPDQLHRRPGVVRGTVAAGLIVVLVAVLAACGGAGAAASPSAAANDLLGAILARGTVVVATDPAYPPQSFAREDATRTTSSKCEPNQLTAGELDGYDVQTAVAVAEELGVEPCFVAPQWTEVTGGSWGDRWDISIGSMDISRDRMDVLSFAQPYYATPSVLFVHADSAFQAAADLAGKRIGACLDCTQYAYLDGSLDLPGQELELAIPDPQIVGYDVEAPGLDDLVADNDKIDAFLASSSVGQAYVDEGKPIRAIDEPLFFGYSAPAFDRRASRDSVAFVNRITEIIQGLHSDGTLTSLSQEFFGSDLASQAGTFDLADIDQQLP